MRRIQYFIALAIGLIIICNLVSAAGVLVDPSKLFIQATVKQEAKKILVVKNISESPLIYNLYSDELTDIITISPSIFRLEPEEEIKIAVVVKPKHQGVMSTNISVVAEDLDRRKFNAAAGIKIPLEIIALPKASINYSNWTVGIIIALLIISLLVIAVIYIIKKRKKTVWHKITSSSVNLLHHQKPWWKRIIG